MLRYVSILLVAASAAVWSAGDLFAQQQGFGGGLVSGQGGGGGGSFGSSGTSFGSSTSGGMGGSSMGSSNGTGLPMLNATALSGGFGILGFGSQNGFGSGTGAGTMYGGRTYGSVTSAGGSSMTSNSTAGGNRTTGSSSSTSGSGRGSASTGGNSSRRGSSNKSATTPKQQAWFEPRIEIGFDVAPTATSAAARSVATSLGSANAGSRFGGVRVVVDGQTAVLRGLVASQNDRQLAEQIALLEPSISSVRNELTIQRAATAGLGSR